MRVNTYAFKNSNKLKYLSIFKYLFKIYYTLMSLCVCVRIEIFKCRNDTKVLDTTIYLV